MKGRKKKGQFVRKREQKGVESKRQCNQTTQVSPIRCAETNNNGKRNIGDRKKRVE